jgi:hypothetical protein
MARGDVKLFASFLKASKSGLAFNLATDAIKLAIVTATTVPTVSTADPRYGAGGTTNFATNAVPTGTGYPAPVSLTSLTYVQSAGVDTFDAADVTIPQDASGFTTGAYGILYDSTVAGNYCIGFVDLGGPVGIQSGPLQIVWNAAGIFTETAA